MRRTGPRAFWLSFFLTLAVAVPLLGGFAFWAIWQNQGAADEAGRAQLDVAIRQPTAKNDFTTLVVVAGEQPAFMLVRLNAPGSQAVVYAVPSQSVVNAPGGTALLADCYTSAGPARAAQLLSETLGIPIHHYLAATPASWASALETLGSVRVNLSGPLKDQRVRELGRAGDPVVELAPAQAGQVLDELGLATPEREAVRAAIWQGVLRQKQELLPTALPDGLRAVSGTLLTDLTAVDLYTLAETLEFLANSSAQVERGVLPGTVDARTARYEFNQDTVDAAQLAFGRLKSGESEGGQASSGTGLSSAPGEAGAA